MKNFKSVAISAIITELVIVILTISAELSAGLKETLKSMTGHHWTSKGIISLVLFFAMYFMYGNVKSKDEDVWKYTKAIFWFTILFSLIILGFFIFEFMK
mgnify:CR=1 FL=1